jgi:hypothetical protein
MIKNVIKTILGQKLIDNSNDPIATRYRNDATKRYHVINYLISKYGLSNYLEIGVLKGDNIRKVNAPNKDGVDPGAERHIAPEVNYKMTSDDFFDSIKNDDQKIYDIIFIDGLHHADQVRKDIYNAVRHLTPGGFILMHDCNPISYESQLVPRKTIVWNGDPWKAFVEFKGMHPNIQCCVVDCDYGVGVIRIHHHLKKQNFLVPEWNEFDQNRKHYLNLVTWDEFKTIF